MARKSQSESLYWAKPAGVALILIVIAFAIIQLQMSNRDPASLPSVEAESKSVAKGFSKFYREFRMTPSTPAESEGGDFVLDIANNGKDLDGRLQSMSSDIKPVNNGWVGEHKHRTFKAGNTLRGAITAYAEQEGMQVIWDLEQDFVIKYQFQLDNTVAGTLAKIASAIDSNFPGEVRTYICPAQRSLVVTANETDYLTTQCEQVKPR